MSSLTKALKIQLKVRKEELWRELRSVEKDREIVEFRLSKLQGVMPSTPYIIPELEINKARFLYGQQQQKASLQESLKSYEEKLGELSTSLRQITRELKRLERYIHQKEQANKKKALKMEELRLDEWSMQQRIGNY